MPASDNRRENFKLDTPEAANIREALKNIEDAYMRMMGVFGNIYEEFSIVEWKVLMEVAMSEQGCSRDQLMKLMSAFPAHGNKDKQGRVLGHMVDAGLLIGTAELRSNAINVILTDISREKVEEYFTDVHAILQNYEK